MSSVCISPPTTHISGPHDHANAATNRQISARAAMATPLGRSSAVRVLNPTPSVMDTASSARNICRPPCTSSFRRPARSASAIPTNVASIFMEPTITAFSSDVLRPLPRELKRMGTKKTIALIPPKCQQSAACQQPGCKWHSPGSKKACG